METCLFVFLIAEPTSLADGVAAPKLMNIVGLFFFDCRTNVACKWDSPSETNGNLCVCFLTAEPTSLAHGIANPKLMGTCLFYFCLIAEPTSLANGISNPKLMGTCLFDFCLIAETTSLANGIAAPKVRETCLFICSCRANVASKWDSTSETY